jgi:hypothetical protein
MKACYDDIALDEIVYKEDLVRADMIESSIFESNTLATVLVLNSQSLPWDLDPRPSSRCEASF